MLYRYRLNKRPINKMEREGSMLYIMHDDMLALANSVSCLLAWSADMDEEE